VVYDLGGVIGGMIAGYTSDKLAMRGVVSFVMLLLTIPALYLYFLVGALGDLPNGVVSQPPLLYSTLTLCLVTLSFVGC
jgi:sugar phosphate permease